MSSVCLDGHVRQLRLWGVPLCAVLFPHPPQRLGAAGLEFRSVGASLTEHEELEVPLGGPGLVLRSAGVEARIALLDPRKVEGPGPIPEVMAAHLTDLGGRGQRELVGDKNGGF